MAIREIAAPIVDLSPDTLVESGGGVVCLGFVAQADGTAAVRWAEVLDPDNPAETIAIKAGQGYPGRIQEIVSCDVALHLYFGSEGVGPYPSGGGAGSSGGGGGGGALAPGAVAPGTIAENIYVIQAGTGGPVLDEVDGSQRLGVVLIGGFARVNQGSGDRSQQWFIASSPDGSQVQQVAIADKQDTGNAALASIDGKIPADPATATKQDVGNIALASIATALGSPLQAGGSVSVSNFPATQPVSGPLTDAELRATAVPVSAASLPLPTGAATETTLSALNGKIPAAATLADNAALPNATTIGVVPFVYNGTNLQIRRGTTDGHEIVVGPVTVGTVATSYRPLLTGGIDVATGGARHFGGVLSGSYLHLITRSGGDASGNALALDSTLTGGAAKTIARGGAKGATIAADVTSTAQGSDHQALDVQIYHGGTAKDPTQIRALTASDVVSADLRVSSAAVSHTNPVPLIVARSTHRTPGSTLPAAATTHTLSASPGTLRRIEWRYTGAGTKYIVLCDQAGGTAAAANWTGWYASMSNGAGKSYFEFPEGIRCASGIVLGVSATEPQAGVAITLSSATNENFTVPFFSIQP